ncbi:unnamed protein product [Toxocara canis]|uniref:Innexin n=1 Tax=Toxocara canis TaxID=6265 RepID=A0A183U1V8_TOXCA|nr:unnamed protein product [Toxocara canis]
MVVEEGTHLRSLYLNYSPTGTCGIDLGCVGRFGSFSSALYVLLKLANTVNVIIQLHVINTFVGDGTLLWGVELTSNLMAGRDWTYTGHFPRVVFCDYDKVELGNVQHKTVQCALAINILNEKFYLDGVEERMGDLDSEVKYLKEKIVDVPWNKERFLDVVQPALYVDDKSSCDSGYSRQDTTQRHGISEDFIM